MKIKRLRYEKQSHVSHPLPIDATSFLVKCFFCDICLCRSKNVISCFWPSWFRMYFLCNNLLSRFHSEPFISRKELGEQFKRFLYLLDLRSKSIEKNIFLMIMTLLNSFSIFSSQRAYLHGLLFDLYKAKTMLFLNLMI